MLELFTMGILIHRVLESNHATFAYVQSQEKKVENSD